LFVGDAVQKRSGQRSGKNGGKRLPRATSTPMRFSVAHAEKRKKRQGKKPDASTYRV
jgi:hypothetical protein